MEKGQGISSLTPNPWLSKKIPKSDSSFLTVKNGMGLVLLFSIIALFFFFFFFLERWGKVLVWGRRPGEKQKKFSDGLVCGI
jgi:hypothetical protein